ncbi:Bifunctional polymyxin resistance protein ArnA [bioreactor metagenome]|uniref:Bifunctional polymyxin resistance protein ArnA n=1 Tax=bioreactor metagenome TaxID=1076179 RepID=A0A645C738_9ZZZZ
MRFLITGGAGFIGGHLTERLLAAGHEVAVLDNFSTGSRRNLAAVAGQPALTVIEGDILNYSGLRELVRDCDIVYHLAAAVGVELVVNDPVRTIRTNVEGSARVLEYAAEYRKRLILASTSEVYGKSSRAAFHEGDDLLIGCPIHSRWSYACSKLLDEFYLMAYHRNQGLPGTVVRFFNTVGPRQTGRYGMVVPRFVAAALSGKAVQVYGNGEQSRCFCHVEDTVRALLGLADCPESVGKIYNIGSTEPISIMELARRVIARLGSSSEIVLVPYDEAYEKGFEDMFRRRPDTRAIEALLDWRAHRSLDDIIDDVASELRPVKGA